MRMGLANRRPRWKHFATEEYGPPDPCAQNARHSRWMRSSWHCTSCPPDFSPDTGIKKSLRAERADVARARRLRGSQFCFSV